MKILIGFISMLLVFSVHAQNQHFFTQVNNSNNDAEEDKDGGSIDLTSSDLELSYDPGVLSVGNQDQWVGIRFTNVTLPEKVIIDSAFVQFTVDETESDPAISQIYGEKSFNSTAFADLDYNISSRNRTDSMLYWTIAAWNDEHDATDLQKTPNLKGIVEEIINQPLWQSGNAMTFIFEGTGTRTAEAYDGESQLAPVLHIYYKIDYSSTEEVVANSVALYPNPAEHTVHLELPSNAESMECSYRIFSPDGKEVAASFIINDQPTAIDVSSYEPGCYTVQVSTGANAHFLRFIKY